MQKTMRTTKSFVRYGSLLFFSLIMVFPLIWMMLSSLKTTDEIFSVPLTLLPETLRWSNFSGALELAPFWLYMFNSAFTSICIVVLQVVLSSMIAYALTQLQFKGKSLLFNSILITYMLPAAATYVPSYILLSKMGLLDSLTGIIISNIANVFTIFLLRQAFLQVPKEMLEAARAEGGNDFTLLMKVMIPMCKSTIFIASLIGFVSMYNNYLWPSLILKSEEKYLITVGLNRFFTNLGSFADTWPLIMAANVLTVLPLLILFILLNKWFIKGIGDNGLKG